MAAARLELTPACATYLFKGSVVLSVWGIAAPLFPVSLFFNGPDFFSCGTLEDFLLCGNGEFLSEEIILRGVLLCGRAEVLFGEIILPDSPAFCSLTDRVLKEAETARLFLSLQNACQLLPFFLFLQAFFPGGSLLLQHLSVYG